jgi:hypothetical protein
MRNWGRKNVREGFPEKFTVQRIGIEAAKRLVDRQPEEIATYLRAHPEVARDLLNESYDKRYSPSTFIAEEGEGFRVGWVPRHAPVECVRRFSNLPDAATDYLLFSFGKGRWTEPGRTETDERHPPNLPR